MNVPIKKEEKASLLAKLKSLKDWFELDVNIKIFGVTVLHWHYPPQDTPTVE